MKRLFALWRFKRAVRKAASWTERARRAKARCVALGITIVAELRREPIARGEPGDRE